MGKKQFIESQKQERRLGKGKAARAELKRQRRLEGGGSGFGFAPQTQTRSMPPPARSTSPPACKPAALAGNALKLPPKPAVSTREIPGAAVAGGIRITANISTALVPEAAPPPTPQVETKPAIVSPVVPPQKTLEPEKPAAAPELTAAPPTPAASTAESKSAAAPPAEPPKAERPPTVSPETTPPKNSTAADSPPSRPTVSAKPSDRITSLGSGLPGSRLVAEFGPRPDSRRQPVLQKKAPAAAPPKAESPSRETADKPPAPKPDAEPALVEVENDDGEDKGNGWWDEVVVVKPEEAHLHKIGSVVFVDPNRILISEQVRGDYKDETILELGESIKQDGQEEPSHITHLGGDAGP